ncbi:MAG: molybdenum ABC transporter ATP-binding protein [Rhodocyclaceae bacterium]|jgi:molybdate transport system ATP-binding protein|nr:molybdenum ABC transporter ATP-binding protein [Rhodocyclaceae bacterium]
MTVPIRARFQVAYPGFSLDVDLSLPGRGVTALYGPSGCGKTTCLRTLAGLERGAQGYLEVGGEVWQDAASGAFLPTHRRPLGYVFQEASLFPHLSVRGNLEYGQRRWQGGEDAPRRRAALEQAAQRLGITPLLERRPERLSGGERQRVAIARALLTRPRLLLMDEPLAALDLARKREILPYLQRLHDELEIPVVYVTHSPDEVARLADHLVVLEQGRVLASGPLVEVLPRLDLPTALADQAGVVVEARVAAYDGHYGLLQLAFSGGALQVPHGQLPQGSVLRVQVWARDVSLALSRPTDSSITNILPATVVAQAPGDSPAHVMVRLEVGGAPLLARITRRSRDQLGLAPGMAVWAQIKAVALLA